MTPLSQLTRRNYLIAAHDGLATAFALLASFYLRFEGGEAFYARLPLLLRILPLFIIFSIVICYVFNLTTTKWRFISLPDALNIMRVASVLTVALIVLDYAFIFAASSAKAPVLFGRITIVLYWFLQVFALSALRFGYRYFRYSRVRRHAQTEGASSTLLVGRAADAEVLLRGIESGVRPRGCGIVNRKQIARRIDDVRIVAGTLGHGGDGGQVSARDTLAHPFIGE